MAVLLHMASKRPVWGQPGKIPACKPLTDEAFRETLLHRPLSSEGLRRMLLEDVRPEDLHRPLSSEGLRQDEHYQRTQGEPCTDL